MNSSQNGSVEINGTSLHYQIEGEGKPAVVIGSALYSQRTFSQNLRRSLRLHFVDHKGFTKASQEEDGKYSLDRIIEDLEAMRGALGLSQFVLLGHSGNGYIALEYAKKYPQHVSELVLIALGKDQSPASMLAADAYFEETTEAHRKELVMQNFAGLHEKIAADPERRFMHFCLALAPRSWHDYRYDAAHLWEGVEVNMPVIDHVWGEIFRDIDVTQGLETITMPVLLALGRWDWLVAPYYTWQPLLPLFRDITLVLFDRSSHCPQLEEQDLFDAKLLNWLRGCTIPEQTEESAI